MSLFSVASSAMYLILLSLGSKILDTRSNTCISITHVLLELFILGICRDVNELSRNLRLKLDSVKIIEHFLGPKPG